MTDKPLKPSQLVAWEYYVVEPCYFGSDLDGRSVAQLIAWPTDGSSWGWYTPGNEQEQPFSHYKPLRRVRLR